MGIYNCRECIEKDINNVNELIINNKLFSSESQQNPNLTSREESLKEIKEIEKEKNEINNETRKKLLKINKNPSQENQINYNNLEKEEKENNTLLKNESNKINDINNEINSNKTMEKESKVDIENNKIITGKNDDMKKISDQMEKQKIIELQNEQILAQQKIIEQYEQQKLLYEKQQLELEQAQLKIKEQQSQLDDDLEPKDTDIILQEEEKRNNQEKEKNNQEHEINNQPQVINNNQNVSRENPQNKLIYQISPNKEKSPLKTSPNIKNIEISKKQNVENKQVSNLSPQQYIMNSQQKEPLIDQEKTEEEELQMEFSQDAQRQQINQGIMQQDDREEIRSYERDELKDETNDYHHYQSQKFKIETYEPVEQEVKNENSDNFYEDDNETEKKNSYKNEDISNKKEIKLEPEDNVNLKRKIIPQQIYNNNLRNKKKSGPEDSGKKKVNFKNRSSVEKDKKLLKIKNVKESGPKDSKRRDQQEEDENDDDGEDEDEDEDDEEISDHQELQNQRQEKAFKNNKGINLEKQYYVYNNPIVGAIGNAILNQENYNVNVNINNQNNFINPAIGQFNQNIYQNRNYIPSNLSLKPKFLPPKIVDINNPGAYNEGNNNLQNIAYAANQINNGIQSYGNNVNLGPYLNGVNTINFAMANQPLIYQNNNQV